MQDSTVRTLQRELSILESRCDALRTAIGALSGETPIQKSGEKGRRVIAKTPPRRRMRKAKRGERQKIVLDAYRSLTDPIQLPAFLRAIGGSSKQRRLYRMTVLRQVGLGRMDMENDMVIPFTGGIPQ